MASAWEEQLLNWQLTNAKLNVHLKGEIKGHSH